MPIGLIATVANIALTPPPTLHVTSRATSYAPARASFRDTAFVESAETTYYMTNRSRSGALLGRSRGDTLEYGLVVTQYRERAGSTGEPRWLSAFSSQQALPQPLARDEFLARVHVADSGAAVRGEGPVVYVHGYATSFRRAIAQGSEIAHRGRFGGPLIVFAWPANRMFASWPTRSALVSGAYRVDSVSAGASTSAFREALQDLLSAVPASRITVVGHSLGAQLVTEALTAASSVRDTLHATPLRALALFAPDISATRFRDSLDTALIPLALRRVIYTSSADRMLLLSRFVNHSVRAGQSGGEHLLAASDVEMVDITDGRRADRGLGKLLGAHHAMRYASTALRDFFGIVRGATADCRTADGLAARLGERSWRLTSAAVPVGDVGCAAGDSATRTQTPPL